MMLKLLRWKVLYNACAQLLRQNNNIKKKTGNRTTGLEFKVVWVGGDDTF